MEKEKMEELELTLSFISEVKDGIIDFSGVESLEDSRDETILYLDDESVPIFSICN